jgi:hypothetical protein
MILVCEPDGVLVFHVGFKSAVLTLKPKVVLEMILVCEPDGVLVFMWDLRVLR